MLSGLRFSLALLLPLNDFSSLKQSHIEVKRGETFERCIGVSALWHNYTFKTEGKNNFRASSTITSQCDFKDFLLRFFSIAAKTMASENNQIRFLIFAFLRALLSIHFSLFKCHLLWSMHSTAIPAWWHVKVEQINCYQKREEKKVKELFLRFLAIRFVHYWIKIHHFFCKFSFTFFFGGRRKKKKSRGKVLQQTREKNRCRFKFSSYRYT